MLAILSVIHQYPLLVGASCARDPFSDTSIPFLVGASCTRDPFSDTSIPFLVGASCARDIASKPSVLAILRPNLNICQQKP